MAGLQPDYSVACAAFTAAGHFIPADKSVENDGPLYAAASTGRPADRECELELGQARGRYAVLARPLWTADDERGPAGENAVAAIIRPLAVRQSKEKKGASQQGSGLF